MRFNAADIKEVGYDVVSIRRSEVPCSGGHGAKRPIARRTRRSLQATTNDYSLRIYWVSVAIYLVGAFFAFGAQYVL